jgi:hypothetical protein
MAKISNAKFVTEIVVTDPDSGGEVQMEIYKHENGGIFAVDSSYLEQCTDGDSYPIIPDVFTANGGLENAGFVMLQE